MTSAAPRILLIEDDASIRRFVRLALEDEGWQVFESETARRGLIEAASRQPDAVVLDLGLPDGDGSEVVRRLRLQTGRPGVPQLPDPATPVLILTARDQVQDRVAGLNLGADDYLVKPFDMDELEARLRAMMRRAAGQASPVIRHADLEVDPAARTIRQAGQKVEVSPREFAVLWALLLARGRVLSRPQIEEHLYSWGDTVESNAVEVYVHHLRKKLGQKIIVTMRGVGYFMPQEQE
jgi:two-component system OmpR family response regulator/two-component system response regulator QseB